LTNAKKAGILAKKGYVEMPAKKYKVTLTTEEREELSSLVSKGKGNARRIKRAHILLLADESQPDGGWKDAAIAKALNAHSRTVERTREKCVMKVLKQLSTILVLQNAVPKYWMVLLKPD